MIGTALSFMQENNVSKKGKPVAPTHLFSFLGTGRYAPVTYELPDWSSPQVTYVQVASAMRLRQTGHQVRRVTAYCTSDAVRAHGEGLRAEYAAHGFDDVELVEITTPNKREEMLEMFDQVFEHLRGCSEPRLCFDMTHGFRVQPGLMLLLLDFLLSIQPDAAVEHIFYGLYVRDSPTADLVDLADFWDLRDWSAGFRAFDTYGDVSLLTRATKKANDRIRVQQGLFPHRDIKNLKKNLDSFAEAVGLHNSIILFGDPDAGVSATISALHDIVSDSLDGANHPTSKYLKPLCRRLTDQLAACSSHDWRDPNSLRSQIVFTKWLYEHQRVAASVTILREVTATLVWHAVSAGGLTCTREEAERLYTGIARDPAATTSPLVAALRDVLPEGFGGACARLIELRNRVNHAYVPRGSCYQPNEGKKLAQDIQFFLDAVPILGEIPANAFAELSLEPPRADRAGPDAASILAIAPDLTPEQVSAILALSAE